MTILRETATGRAETRTVLVEVAAGLLRERGAAAVTTRAVAQSAGVQPPTIYRLFGDKDGLLDAVAEHVFAAYVAEKASAVDRGEPLADLRAGWDTYIGFGLDNVALYGLLVDPNRAPTAGDVAGLHILQKRVRRVAASGRLRVSEARAVELIHAAGVGAVLTLLSLPDPDRRRDVADALYDAVLSSILTEPPARATDDTTAAVVAFHAVLPEVANLTEPERALLSEWLDRPGPVDGSAVLAGRSRAD